MHPSRHWFVPLAQLDTLAALTPANVLPTEADRVAQRGDALLVTLESVLIVKKHDKGSNNDLLVRSRLKYGNNDIVEAINFFANDVPPGEVQTNLLCEHIYTHKRYSKQNRIHLELEVMELPGDISLNKNVGRGLNTIKNAFGLVLSSLLPFGGVAFSAMERLNNVRSDSRRIFLSALDLYGEGGEGEARLRYGAYVFFQEPVDGSQYALHQLQVKHAAPDAASKPIPYDYLVVKIVPNSIRVGSDEELVLQNQELAATLGTIDGQLDKRGQHPRFRDNDAPAAGILRRLALFYRLQKQKAARGVLDEAQATLYEKLQQELKNFL
ncbi:MAG: hypothetical protein AAF959_04905 [Cyanobacteria bacterium P01_D01_bin.56]